MRPSVLLAFTCTDAAAWITPGRILVGIFLTFQLGGGLHAQLAWCRPVAGVADVCGPALTGLEVGFGASFIFGALVRVAAPGVIFDLALRSLAGWAAAIPQLPLAWIVVPTGDWIQAAVMLGGAVLAMDVLESGSGPISLDSWLHDRLSRTGE